MYISLEILRQHDAKFCPCNASKDRGRYINGNMEQVESIFSTSVSTFAYSRSANMLSCCPTDGQAEILIKDNIPRNCIIGIAVGDNEIAGRIYAMYKTYNLNLVPLYIAPDVLTYRMHS